jgi:hypothetical protein
MLCDIDESCFEDARRLLTILCFSTRLPKVTELIHAYAVDLDELSHLDREGRFLDTDSLGEICPGLIDIAFEEDDSDSGNENQKEMIPVVRIAHFSVQEYLESDRIKQQKAAIFALSSDLAHSEIAEICLAYLLEPELSNGQLDMAKLEEFPLAQFAAQFWHVHYKKANKPPSRVEELVIGLFKTHEDSFYNWVRLGNMDNPKNEYIMDLELLSAVIPSQVYYASLLGLDHVLLDLIAAEAAKGVDTRYLVCDHQGYFNSAIIAASFKGHQEVVQVLLDYGAELNAQCSTPFRDPLHAAVIGGHRGLLDLLLRHGASPFD